MEGGCNANDEGIGEREGRREDWSCLLVEEGEGGEGVVVVGCLTLPPQL